MELILFVQPDPQQASALRCELRDRTNAEVVIVDSRDAALAVISRQVPDLILFPALMSPEDEHHLVSHLRTLPDAAHLQTLTVPPLELPSDDEGRRRGLLSALRPRQILAGPIGCEPGTFAGEIVEYLARARAIREEIEHSKIPEEDFSPAADLAAVVAPGPESLASELVCDPAESVHHSCAAEQVAVVTPHEEDDASDAISASDRRGARRWLPGDVPWVRSVRLAEEPAELVNISSGGVLIRAGFRPEMQALNPYRDDSESPLDLVFYLTSGREVFAPGRIVRCRVASVGSGPLRYEVAVRFDATVGLDLPDQPILIGEILKQPPTVRADRLARLLSRCSLPASEREALTDLTAVDTELAEIQLTLREARHVNAELGDLTSRLGPRIRQLQTLRTEIVGRFSRDLMAVAAA